MNALKSIDLMNKYVDCPCCGNEYIGNGQGGIIIEDDTFRRWCKCGYDITIDEDDNILKFKNGEKYEKDNK